MPSSRTPSPPSRAETGRPEYDLPVRTNKTTVEALEARNAELERERELLNAIANHAPSLLCLVGADGRVRAAAANIAFERRLGYAAGEPGGDFFWRKYVPPEDAERARETIERAIRGEPAEEQDGRWLTKDGEIVDVSWSCTELPMIESGPVYLICGTDITERKRHEEEVRTSRSRIVTAADDARRRLERNLHDGAQQRLVALLLSLRAAKVNAAGNPDQERLLDGLIEGLNAALQELRELARGIHPVALNKRGLAAALRLVTERAPIDVELDVPMQRFPEQVEATAYYVVAEALTNVAKYAQASSARVRIEAKDRRLEVEIRDDGVGGANAAEGSGLRGLADRLAAVDGSFDVESEPGAGTRVSACIPLG
jgi:PAS domain S-box-containing protein